MCNCIECCGDQPEPYAAYEDGEIAIFYKEEQLTSFHETEEEAWKEFDSKYNN